MMVQIMAKLDVSQAETKGEMKAMGKNIVEGQAGIMRDVRKGRGEAKVMGNYIKVMGK